MAAAILSFMGYACLAALEGLAVQLWQPIITPVKL